MSPDFRAGERVCEHADEMDDAAVAILVANLKAGRGDPRDGECCDSAFAPDGCGCDERVPTEEPCR